MSTQLFSEISGQINFVVLIMANDKIFGAENDGN